MVECACAIESDSPCPNLGCGDIISEMTILHGYAPEKLKWRFISTAELVDGVGDHVEEFNSFLKVSDMMKHRVLPKTEWDTFRCKTCHMVTHASRSQKGLIAAIVNIPVLSPEDSPDGVGGITDLRRPQHVYSFRHTNDCV